jgi:hypothetical protein
LRTIEIIVHPNGETTLQTQGFSGSACRQASKFLEQALGRVSGEQLTSEFYQATTVEQAQQQRL